MDFFWNYTILTNCIILVPIVSQHQFLHGQGVLNTELNWIVSIYLILILSCKISRGPWKKTPLFEHLGRVHSLFEKYIIIVIVVLVTKQRNSEALKQF